MVQYLQFRILELPLKGSMAWNPRWRGSLFRAWWCKRLGPTWPNKMAPPEFWDVQKSSPWSLKPWLMYPACLLGPQARRLPQTVCRGFVQCEILRRRETIGYSDPVFSAQGTLFWIVLNATSRIVLNVLRPRGRSPFFIEFSCESPRKARAHWLSSGCIVLRFDWYMHWHPKQKPMHFWTRSEVMRVSWV
jgi:hypothetical protein